MDDEAMVDWKGLKEIFGWPYSRAHTWRLMAAGKFPKCFKPPWAHRSSHPMWKRREIVAYFQTFQPLVTAS